MRAAIHADARRIVENLLNDRDLVPETAPVRDMEVVYRNRTRTVQTLFGPVKITRNYHYHTAARTGHHPLDEELELTSAYTPSVIRLICRASAQSGSYQQAGEDLAEYAGLKLEHRGFARILGKTVPELTDALATLPPTAGTGPETRAIPILYVSCDGTGVPARKEDLEGRKGKQPDGSARTREAKLGCVFTQSGTDEEGKPIRDPGSTSYVGTLQGCREAGIQLRQEAVRRGYAWAQTTVYLGDGAAWVWENARLNFPGTIEILDFYHAAEHAGDLARAIWPSDPQKAEEYQDRWCKKMKSSSAQPVIESARRQLKNRGERMEAAQKQAIETELHYFETNRQRMRYGHFRAKGYFIGSGVIEAGCKTVIGRRMKQSGMFWGEEGAENILNLRCLVLGPHFERAWDARREIVRKKQTAARRWSPELN